MKDSPSSCHAPAKASDHAGHDQAADGHSGYGHAHGHISAGGSAPAPGEPVYMGLPHESYLRPKFYAAAALTLPVLVLSMGEMVWPGLIDPRTSGWLQLLLTTPVFFWSGAPFIRRWWKALRTRDNIAGRLPELFRGAGFTSVTEEQTFPTIYGTMSLYRARRP